MGNVKVITDSNGEIKLHNSATKETVEVQINTCAYFYLSALTVEQLRRVSQDRLRTIWKEVSPYRRGPVTHSKQIRKMQIGEHGYMVSWALGWYPDKWVWEGLNVKYTVNPEKGGTADTYIERLPDGYLIMGPKASNVFIKL